MLVASGASITEQLPAIPPVATPSRPTASPATASTTALDQRPVPRPAADAAPQETAEQPQDVPPNNPAPAELSPGVNNAVSLANANATPTPAPPRRDPTAAVAAMPAPAAPTAPDAPPDASAANQRVFGAVGVPTRVSIRAVQDSWMQVKDAAGNVVATRTLQPGDVFNVPDIPGMRMTTGNAGGLQIMVDGAQSPWMGRSGEVVRNVLLEPPNLMRGRNLGN